MNADEINELFDISPNLDSDYSNADESTSQTFDAKCDDIRAVMEHEPQKNDTDIINEAIDIDKYAVVKEMKEHGFKESAGISDDSVIGTEQTNERECTETSGLEADAKLTEQTNQDTTNPLNLQSSDLNAYKDIKEKYPQFVLSDGSQTFRDFYIFKLKVLKDLLSAYPVLPLQKMKEEIRNVKFNHHVGDTYASPELLRKKMDDCYYWRTRVTTLLMEAHQQYNSWHRSLELLHGKLWKDHDIKPAHRRDGLVAEHLYDIESYASRLKDFIKSTDFADNILKAAAESLSRQIACIQIKESTGFSHAETSTNSQSMVSNKLDSLDGVEQGKIISVPGKEDNTVDFGSNEDLSDLGF